MATVNGRVTIEGLCKLLCEADFIIDQDGQVKGPGGFHTGFHIVDDNTIEGNNRNEAAWSFYTLVDFILNLGKGSAGDCMIYHIYTPSDFFVFDGVWKRNIYAVFTVRVDGDESKRLREQIAHLGGQCIP